MKIEVRHIPQQGITLSFHEDARNFDSVRQLIETGEVDFASPVDITLELLAERDSIRVRGRLSFEANLTCSRCTEIYSQHIESQFNLAYSHQIPTELNRSEDNEIELTAEQIGVIYFNGDEIDFRDGIQEQLVLSLPFKPLCTPACKGLCPGCGADLNLENCRCKSKNKDGPFAALKKLKLQH